MQKTIIESDNGVIDRKSAVDGGRAATPRLDVPAAKVDDGGAKQPVFVAGPFGLAPNPFYFALAAVRLWSRASLLAFDAGARAVTACRVMVSSCTTGLDAWRRSSPELYSRAELRDRSLLVGPTGAPVRVVPATPSVTKNVVERASSAVAAEIDRAASAVASKADAPS